MTVRENLAQIEMEITHACQRVGRSANEVKLIAVTKYVSEERAKEALAAGIVHFGENRAEDGVQKWHALEGKGTWHFIGTLQSRKVKEIIDKFDYIHSLDRLSLAREIQKRAKKQVKCFVQVNIAEEESKHGLVAEELLPFLKQLEQFPAIEVIGLMTMAPNVTDQQLIRSVFRKLKELQADVQKLQLSYASCRELSMGMSNDYSLAVEEGATFIRLGTSLVGDR